MKITLDANPSDAPCCVKIEAEDGRNRLIQTDWDWPGIAGTFGWDKRRIQKDFSRSHDPDFEWFAECGVFGCPNCSEVWYPMELEGGKCPDCDSICQKLNPCDHSGTDGTVDCKCGLKAGDFIADARNFIDHNDGATVEDPGYFS